MAHASAYHPILERRIAPHRSLKPSNTRWLLAFFAVAGFFTSLPFVLLGAWPVAGFMGLDVVLLFWAFRASFRAARAYEDVIVTPLELQLAKVSERGARAEWRFNSLWVRLEREEHEEFGVQRLAFVSRGRRVEFAGFLGAEEKAELAADVARALAQARRGPDYS